MRRASKVVEERRTHNFVEFGGGIRNGKSPQKEFLRLTIPGSLATHFREIGHHLTERRRALGDTLLEYTVGQRQQAVATCIVTEFILGYSKLHDCFG